MSFEWIKKFHRTIEKPENYAEKTLDAYRLGMKAGGSIRGVEIQAGEGCCQAARELPAGEVYHPDNAPRLPLDGCPLGKNCQCVYRPVMTYQEDPQ